MRLSVSVVGKRREESAAPLIRQAMLFGLVGLSNTAVDFITFAVLSSFFSTYYLLAQMLSYTAGTLNSYLWNAGVTFAGSAKAPGRFIKFIVLNATVLLLTVIALRVFHFMPLLWDKLLCTLIGTAVNFVLSKLWVFKA
ncbi:MAG: GtrA family protein [Sporolactobacillus sp.]|nr:GtrA family protein [Sporolactobacillus sp.]